MIVVECIIYIVTYMHDNSLQVIFYIFSQLLGSISASGTLSLIMDVTPEAFFGTTPVASTTQSFIVEIIITFILMFVISGATNDHRAVFFLIGLFCFKIKYSCLLLIFDSKLQIKKHGGIAVGMTIMLNVFVGGLVFLFS